MQVNGLLFQDTAEPFDEDVVQVASTTIHWDFDLAPGQRRGPVQSRIMATLICVQDLLFAVFDGGRFQSLKAKARIQHVGKPLDT